MKERSIPLLAVDGGGTKCLAVFTDRQGKIEGTGRGGSCNYQTTGKEAAVDELVRAMKIAKEELGEPPVADEALRVECAVFGMAGLDTGYDRQIIEGLVREALSRAEIRAERVVVENDGLAALLGATDGKPGVLLIAGTGSIVYGVNGQGRSARAGGWGYRVGDEGSAYWIGKQALTAILQTLDGRQGPTSLARRVLPYLDLRSEEELYNWVYSADYRVDTVAELSLLVSDSAREGDASSLRILEAAADELFYGGLAVIEKLGMKDTSFTLILQGGVLQNNEFVRSTLTKKLREFAPSCNLEEIKKEPIYGVIAQGLSLLP
ncbi:N-acetylglucosamine kinase [Paenibacillus chitinolyticus]|uniref:N-acetylglucosamine kinase n=1 Tax=Paenibacillus chitinolyticus TaxID=79263 RepID=UPI0036DD708D